MAAYNGFEDFVLRLGMGTHQLHAAGHQFKVYLTNNVPDAAADTGKGDLLGITEENNYAPVDIENDYTEAAGVGTFSCQDKVWTASGGSFGPGRYVVLFNEDATVPVDALVAWWDYLSSVTVNDGETFTVNFGVSTFTISVV